MHMYCMYECGVDLCVHARVILSRLSDHADHIGPQANDSTPYATIYIASILVPFRTVDSAGVLPGAGLGIRSLGAGPG
jgi:hypothetical protein